MVECCYCLALALSGICSIALSDTLSRIDTIQSLCSMETRHPNFYKIR